jgi:hypothetical protein
MSVETQTLDKLCEIEYMLRVIMQHLVSREEKCECGPQDYTDTAPEPSRRRVGRPPKAR